MTPTLRDYFEFAIETADLAGKLTLGYFQSGLRPEFKEDDTPVTAADREAEKLIRRRIQERFPDQAIVGEEYGETQSEGASHRWFVDPIDGTRAFVRGVPMYANLIVAVLRYEQIKTTEAKAKEVRGQVERMITLAKRGDLSARRTIVSQLPDEPLVVNKLMTEIAPKYADRTSGYTRIVRIGPRRGDAAEIVQLELV